MSATTAGRQLLSTATGLRPDQRRSPPDYRRVTKLSVTGQLIDDELRKVRAGDCTPWTSDSSVVAVPRPSAVVVEHERPDWHPVEPAFADDGLERPPPARQQAAELAATMGSSAGSIRLPSTVHGEGAHDFLPNPIGIAREKGARASVGEAPNMSRP